jgi:hypothetical protein
MGPRINVPISLPIVKYVHYFLWSVSIQSSIYLSVCLSIYLSVCLSMYPSICLSVCLSVCLLLCRPLLGLGRFFGFFIFYKVDRTPWTGDQSVARPLPVHRTTQTQNKRTQTSMPRVGFERTIPVFERAKTVHALDRVATGISLFRVNF